MAAPIYDGSESPAASWFGAGRPRFEIMPQKPGPNPSAPAPSPKPKLLLRGPHQRESAAASDPDTFIFIPSSWPRARSRPTRIPPLPALARPNPHLGRHGFRSGRRAAKYDIQPPLSPGELMPRKDLHRPQLLTRRRIAEATREEMRQARLPLAYRDNCAHILIPLNKCRRETWYAPWKCTVSLPLAMQLLPPLSLFYFGTCSSARGTAKSRTGR